MPKPPTFPPLFDEVYQFSVSQISRAGYLNPGRLAQGVLNFKSNGRVAGRISFLADTRDERPYIELDYQSNGEPRRYKVYLVNVPSNLGRGNVWYFLCPKTWKRCRKLYCVGGYFLHREAFRGCMYDCQTRARKHRDWDKLIGPYFELEELYLRLGKKNLKRTYAGKPTKTFLQLKRKIELANRVQGGFVETLFLV
jgi:hypothetical protein